MVLEDDLTPPAPGKFRLRSGHLVLFAPEEATAYVRLADGTPVLEGVDFGDVNVYIPLPAGAHEIIITTPSGDTTLIDPLLVTFTEGQIVSALPPVTRRIRIWASSRCRLARGASSCR